jgi:murein DD-endopeptidase MepM/ murein hydrolase activator NlpD
MARGKLVLVVCIAFVAGFGIGSVWRHQPPVKKVSSSRRAPSPHPVATDADVRSLEARRLTIPVQGIDLRQVKDTFNEVRGSGRHEATDIMAPRGSPILAADDGLIKKLFTSRLGGLTIYQFDASQTYCYYYAHLDRYAEGVYEGQPVHRGDRIGYVGSTGDAAANTPHLHFAIFKLGPEKKWWQGTPIDPYPILMVSRSN